MTPEFSLKSITFSGGQKIALEPDSVTVIVGANNCGKTTCLHEICRWLADDQFRHPDRMEPPRQLVVASMETQRAGTVEDVDAWLRQNVYLGPDPRRWANEKRFRWLGQECDPSSVNSSWKGERLEKLAGILCAVMGVEDRLSVSEPQEAIESSREAPTHPIHALAEDDRIELAISECFNSAFHTDLILSARAAR